MPRHVLAVLCVLFGPTSAWAQSPSEVGSLGPEVGLATPAGDSALVQLEQTARAAETRGDWHRAASAWRVVLSRDAVYAPAVLGLGRALEAQGDVSGAAGAYGRLPADADVVMALAMLILDDDPAGAAELFERLESLRLGAPEPHRLRIMALTRVDPAQALPELELWLSLVDGEPDGSTITALAQALRERGDEEGAVAVLRHYLEAWPQGDVAEEARGRLDRMAVERAARELSVGASRPLSSELRERVVHARLRAAAGQVEPALSELREVVQQAPRSSDAWGALGDVHTLLGRVDEAERAYAWAAALAPDEATWDARLALLLRDRYGGRRDSEADELLARALALRPAWSELHFRQGQVRQARGDWTGAVDSYQAYVDAEPDGAFAPSAQQALADLLRSAPSPPKAAGNTEIQGQASDEALQHYRIARVYSDQGDLDASRAELKLALQLTPQWPAALNLDAALKMRAGDDEGALAAWRASLESSPDQPLVLLNLGQRLRHLGDRVQAHELLTAAAEGGAEDAWYLLAELAWEDQELLQTRRYLDEYRGAATGGLSREAASALRDKVERRILLIKVLASSLVSVLSLLLGGFWVRRHLGKPLAVLLAEAPDCAHDLARLLSAIRHEVLKHNTTLLDEVAVALENGDHHAVAWAAIRLFGAGRGEAGVVDRFDDYLAAITQLGRRHGVRLDLRRRDPVLAPMWQSMQRLRKLAPVLRKPARAASGVPTQLRALSVQLNQDAYRALGRLIRKMGLLTVDAQLIREVDDRVRSEPALGGQQLPVLDIDFPPEDVVIRVFRGDFEDILANLLRNALGAVLTGVAPGLRRVAVAVALQDDPITGLEEVRLEVRDNAPGKLTNEMLRGRSIGRGLGLAVDLITRHAGSIHVETVHGVAAVQSYTKAVVVTLPRAEGGDEP